MAGRMHFVLFSNRSEDIGRGERGPLFEKGRNHALAVFSIVSTLTGIGGSCWDVEIKGEREQITGFSHMGV